ncbi:MAG: SUMF1/EgtB/PvdO family nonheme iron enzyme, partial [Chloroflexi bacterium]|nr:SUMF1/EgtB/PvdO family nonheme iron enzyme [Chloroflexota bacterium]
MFFHQLIQEYFAARELARRPQPELTRDSWRAAELEPALPGVIAALGPGEPLPALPGSGWEEACLMAAVMAPDSEAFVQGLADANLVLAGRAALQPELAGRLPDPLLARLRRDLIARSRDPQADLRARIAAGRVLGRLGDPRFEARQGPEGAYLLPPLVEIAAGRYPIGDDAALRWEDQRFDGHQPAHRIALAGFAIGRFAVTNAEWACFLQAGGYEDPRWWPGAPAQAWRRGAGSDDDARRNNREWRQHFRASPERIAQFSSLG